jgi:hypothetical protein
MKSIQKLKEVLHAGHKLINEQQDATEAARLGELRAGSAGAITADGKAYYTQCGRLAQARLLGHQQQPTTEMRAMFNGGFALENYLEEQFKAAGFEHTKEPKYSKEIAPGLTVYGRPDFEFTIEGTRVGLEIKSLASPFSVIKQVKNGFPLMKHLLQAAVYTMICDRSEWLFAVGNVFFANEKGQRVSPGLRFYEFRKAGDSFTISNEAGETTTLPFTVPDIIRYYQQVQDKTKAEELLPRPTEQELRISTYNRCNYCHMKSACNEADAKQISFKDWMKRVLINKESFE